MAWGGTQKCRMCREDVSSALSRCFPPKTTDNGRNWLYVKYHSSPTSILINGKSRFSLVRREKLAYMSAWDTTRRRVLPSTYLVSPVCPSPWQSHTITTTVSVWIVLFIWQVRLYWKTRVQTPRRVSTRQKLARTKDQYGSTLLRCQHAHLHWPAQ